MSIALILFFCLLLATAKPDSCIKQADSVAANTFNVICPPGCHDTNDKLWGTNVYTDDSYICAAAIHAGVITNAGGSVTVHKSPGRTFYRGRMQNGIVSKSYGKWSSSFYFAHVNTQENLCLKNADTEPRDQFLMSCPSGCQTMTNQIWGTTNYTTDSYICAAAIHAGFITAQGGVVSVRKIPGLSSYVASTQHGIRSRSYGRWGKSFTFEDLCLKNIEDESECEISMTCPTGCQSNSLAKVRGTDVYTADSSICSAAIHAGVVTDVGGQVTVYKSAGRPSYNGSTQNRIRSHFHQRSNASFQFEKVCTTRGDAEQGNFDVACTCGCANVNDRLWGSRIYTDDSYVCAAGIHDGRVSDAAGGLVTVQKFPGLTSYAATTRHGLTSKRRRSWHRSFVFEDTCTKRAVSESADEFELQCSAGCQVVPARLWGCGIYTSDSYICVAAIHAGVLSSSGGTVRIQKIPGQLFYTGTSQNGITSAFSQSWKSSFRIKVECTTRGDALPGSPANVYCPSGCWAISSRLWGVAVYTSDSYVCQAAIHAGRISDRGGMVEVRKSAGRSSYRGGVQNGISSLSFGSWETSFEF